MNTSINLPLSITNEIRYASKKSGISQSKLTILLIEKIKYFSSIKEIKGILVEYQDRYNNNSCFYDKMHFYPNSSIIDFTKMLRFKFRISLSKLVCAAFLFFWDSILKDLFEENKKAYDNYEKILDFFHNLIIYFRERLNYHKITPIKRE